MNPIVFLLCASLPAVVDQAPQGAIKLLRPGTRADATYTASTSRAPWVDANGWRYRRDPNALYLYEGVAANRLPLAAAEAFVYGGEAVIQTDAAGRKSLEPMMAFLKRIDGPRMEPVADILVMDDGTPQLGEIMNLLSRRNLLFTPGRENSGKYKLVVEVGTPDFPKAKAANPSEFAQLVRKKLTDPQRSLRIYGSEVIVGYLTSDGGRARLHLLNYATDPVESFRIRLLGGWKVNSITGYGEKEMAVEELEYYDGGTEFGIPRLNVYAVVDMSKKK